LGLDGTIKRSDGKPLGPLAEVQQALALAFPGVEFGRLMSGAEKLRAAAAQGVEFPEILRQHFESSPAHEGVDYQGPGFSAQFNLGSDEVVQQVDVVLYGQTVAAEPMFEFLEERYGWITTYP
jgi:hypothetical protein